MRAVWPDDSGMVHRRVCCSPQFDWLPLTLVTHHQVSDRCCRTVVKVMWIILWCRRWFLFLCCRLFRVDIAFRSEGKEKCRTLDQQHCRCYSHHLCGSLFFWHCSWTQVSWNERCVCIFRGQLLVWFCCISLPLLYIKTFQHSGIRISL